MRLHIRAAALPTFMLAVLSAFGAPRAGAQVQLAGQWLVRYEHEAAGMHVAPARTEQAIARMTLMLRGDSVYGQWQPVVAAGETPPAARAIHGQRTHDGAALQLAPASESDGFFMSLIDGLVDYLKLHIHGIPPMITYIDLSVRGDSLSGVRRSASVDGTVQGRSRDIAGARVR